MRFLDAQHPKPESKLGMACLVVDHQSVDRTELINTREVFCGVPKHLYNDKSMGEKTFQRRSYSFKALTHRLG
jgi:hypothetical protein